MTSAAERAVLPALPSPSFPPASILSASRWNAGSVVFPNNCTVGTTVSQPSSSREESRHSNNNNNNDNNDEPSTATVLDRRSSMEGNVLCIDDTQYFWLQRALRGTTTNGIIRAGFCLKPPVSSTSAKTTNPHSDNSVWEVVVANPSSNEINKNNDNEKCVETQVQMVAVRIEDASDFMESSELAALSYVADSANNNSTTHAEEHIQNAMLVATDESNVYIVMPYDTVTSISLFDYCLTQPNSILPETQAREFTKQILSGLECLQNMTVCHQNLTLDSVVLRPTMKQNVVKNKASETATDYCCIIRNFENAIRVPSSTTTDADGTATITTHMITHASLEQPLLKGQWNIQYAAPEIWNSSSTTGSCSSDNNTEERNETKNHHLHSNSGTVRRPPFDGYAIDLWAVGVMVLSMLFGNDAIFVAPIPEDRIFQQISVHGQLKEYYAKKVIQTTTTTTTTGLTTTPPAIISDNAFDLLQQLLRYNPSDRPTLSEVLQHPWITES